MREAGLSPSRMPTKEQADAKLRKLIEEATRKFSPLARQTDEFIFTARATDDIGFTGASKIAAIMQYDWRYGLDPHLVSFPYNANSLAVKTLLDNWRQHIGSSCKIVPFPYGNDEDSQTLKTMMAGKPAKEEPAAGGVAAP